MVTHSQELSHANHARPDEKLRNIVVRGSCIGERELVVRCNGIGLEIGISLQRFDSDFRHWSIGKRTWSGTLSQNISAIGGSSSKYTRNLRKKLHNKIKLYAVLCAPRRSGLEIIVTAPCTQLQP